MIPRQLHLLRVDDEIHVFANDLPVDDLGQISTWNSFVTSLRERNFTTSCLSENRVLKKQAISFEKFHPDLLAVDFRFSEDNSTPRLSKKNPDKEHPLVKEGVDWSDKLIAKNTGLTIGASLLAMLVNRSNPSAFALHSNAPEETGKDMTSLLLLGQMLACVGENLDHDQPLVSSYEYLKRLADSGRDACLQACKYYRKYLLEYFQAKKSQKRLYLHPDSNELLLHFDQAFSDAEDTIENQQELDCYLEKQGLKFLNTHGEIDCLDLRSLFMDKLTKINETRRRKWGYISISDIQEGGIIYEFLHTALERSGYYGFEVVADLVYQNSKCDKNDRRCQKKKLDNKQFSSISRIAAVVFAVISHRVHSPHPPKKGGEYGGLGTELLGWTEQEAKSVGWSRAFKDTVIDHKEWYPKIAKLEPSVGKFWQVLAGWYVGKYYANVTLHDDIKIFISGNNNA